LSEQEQLEMAEAWEDSDEVITEEEPLDETVEEEVPPPAPAPAPPANGQGQKEYVDTTLWKKWTVFQGVGRFLTIRPWLEAAKVAIDIGETGDGGTLKGNTLAWANIVDLATYLQAVRDGRGDLLYPANAKTGANTKEGFSYFGGATVDGQPISRVLKIHHWPVKDAYDSTAFMWKCGHFKASKSQTGAFIPNMKEPLSNHAIKVSRLEMATLANVLHLALVNHAANTPSNEWLEQISGRKK
jgi:hypothetical protein